MNVFHFKEIKLNFTLVSIVIILCSNRLYLISVEAREKLPSGHLCQVVSSGDLFKICEKLLEVIRVSFSEVRKKYPDSSYVGFVPKSPVFHSRKRLKLKSHIYE